jgi:hypothetical protein
MQDAGGELLLMGILGSSFGEPLGRAVVLTMLSAGSECLPAFPLYGVQNLLRLREKLVELVCRSGNVDDHRLPPTSTMTNRSFHPS